MIKTFTGPMFSGKTTALLTTYFNMWNKTNILCFKPKINTRDEGIKSKNIKDNVSAIEIDDLIEIKDYIKKNTKTIFIDEANFLKGDVNVLVELSVDENIDIYVCGLAKDDRHQTAVLLDMNGEEVAIDRQTPLFYLLTRMQDEVHRYAISFHRQVRSKSLLDSIIDDVEGIGPKRKKQLLSKFGSVKKMREASLEELEEAVPKNVALSLYQRLHQDDK